MSAQNTAKGNPTLNLRKRNVMSLKTQRYVSENPTLCIRKPKLQVEVWKWKSNKDSLWGLVFQVSHSHNFLG